MSEALPTCCEFHGYQEGGCNGRNCPEGRVDLRAILTRRVSEADMLRQCARSGQVDSRQIAAHAAAGELDGLGVEAADAPRVTGLVPPIVTTELRPVRKPLAVDWQGVVIYGGVVACMFALAWLSTADPRDLSSFWPRVLAALSL